MQDLINQALQLQSDGKTRSEIAKALGKSRNMVSLYLNPEALRRHREKSKAWARQRYKEDPSASLAASKKWMQNNREKYNAGQRRRWAKNPAKHEYHRNYYRALKAKDPGFARTCILRCALANWAIAGTKKRRDGLDVAELVGCSRDEFQKHLTSQFTEVMSWDTYGTSWELDHIKPLMDFNVLDQDQAKLAFHWTNTRPLHPSQNRGRERRERGQWAAPESQYVEGGNQ